MRTRIALSRSWTLVAISCIVVLGCSQPETVETEAEAVRQPPKPINVILVDAPGIDEEIVRQWASSRDGVVNIATASAADIADNDYASLAKQDIIIYPPKLMGQLSADKRILELPDEVWESEQLDNRAILRNSRTKLIRFDNKRWAVPLGNSNFSLFCRSDVLELTKTKAPETWDDLIAISKAWESIDDLKDVDGNSLPTNILIPSKGEYAAHSMLAIAASSVRHRGKLNALFDRETMEPLIDREPFVAALSQLKALTKEFKDRSVNDVMDQFCRGEAAIVVGWPAASFITETEISDLAIDKCEIHRLPGSTKWFDFSAKSWQEVEDDQNDEGVVAQVELLGFNGLQASLLTTNAHPTTAFEFLSWLGSKQSAVKLFASSPQASPTRASHLGNTLPWTGDMLSVANSDLYSEQLAEINEQHLFLRFPRIRGIQEYLDELSRTVRSSLQGQTSPEAALQDVAKKWSELTEKYDKRQQARLLRMDIEL